MHVSELINHDILCDCGKVHRCDIPHFLIGKGVLANLPEMVLDYRHILLVADQNTYPLCGDRVRGMLQEKIEAVCVLESEGLLVPGREAVGIVDGFVSKETDLVLGIGSGVVNDICKYVSCTHNIPCGIIATAPSMDGYASSGAAMIFDGMKITFTPNSGGDHDYADGCGL